MLKKGMPSQKRKIQTTLASFHNSNPHIDLIAFVYEHVTEEKFVDEEDEVELLYSLIDIIKNQLGVEKYLEVILFIAKMKRKYVTDLRKSKLASEKTLVFFDATGRKVVNSCFDCMLLLQELQVFVPDSKLLKKMLEEERRQKRGKLINS